MYPLIQEHVWAKVASEEDLLRTVLDTFIRVSVCVRLLHDVSSSGCVIG